MPKSKKKRRSIGLFLFIGLFLASVIIVIQYYEKIYSSNVKVNEEEYFFISTGMDRPDLLSSLVANEIILDSNSWNWVADRKQFYEPKPGRYQLKEGMSNNDLINLFRSGMQSPVQLTFNTVRTKEDLARIVAQQIEADSLNLIQLLNDPQVAGKYGFNNQTFMTLFLPNTYEFYWNTNAEQFLQRMALEFKKYWTDERKMKANSIGLSQSEVSILASIVQAEQEIHVSEQAKVAGLYLNRLRRGMRLQSDPTLVFAIGDFSIRRVLNNHKQINSPYNTYLNSGLPPGPINLPSLSAINAVLNAEKHSYLYMCAKSDFSGYHDFSKSLRQHEHFARAYRRELNKKGIMH